MRRIFLGITISVLALAALCGNCLADETMDKIRHQGVIVAGVRIQVHPFGFIDPETGVWSGYEVDLARAVSERMGLKLELRPVDRARRFSALAQGRVDFILGNLSPDPDLKKLMAFSNPYLFSGVGFIAPKGKLKGIEKLVGKKIAALSGSFTEQAVTEQLPGSTVVAFADLGEAIGALERGEVDAGAGDESLLPALLPMLRDARFEITDYSIARFPYVIGIRRDAPELKKAVNEALSTLLEGGQLDKIYEKWFGPLPEERLAAAAAGVVLRKASTPPRFLAAVFQGEFSEGDEISILSRSGDFICKGTISAVFGDQVYVDADKMGYTRVKPGFAIGSKVDQEAAKKAILANKDIFDGVAAATKAEEEAIQAQNYQEAIEEERRRKELQKEKDLLNHKKRAAMDLMREAEYNRYYRHRNYRNRHHYDND